MWPLIAAMAAAGLLKSEFVDRPKEERQRRLKAEEQRNSWWTKMAPTTQIQEADPLGSAIQYGTTGAMMGQGMQEQKDSRDFANKWLAIQGAQQLSQAQQQKPQEPAAVIQPVAPAPAAQSYTYAPMSLPGNSSQMPEWERPKKSIWFNLQ